MKIHAAIIGLAGEFEVGFADAQTLISAVAAQLATAGLTVGDPQLVYDDQTVEAAAARLSGQATDVLVVCVATWSEDPLLLDLLEAVPVPVIIWAFPAVETGSLCGAHQICSVLKELGKSYFFVYGHPDDRRAVAQVMTTARAAALYRQMRRVRIGTVGGRVKGMTDIACDELEIKRIIGARIINLSESELTAVFEQVAPDKAKALWRETSARAGSVLVLDREGEAAMRWYKASSTLIENNRLDGICVKCYPSFMGRVCLGYALLAEAGIVCGCEGDSLGTVAMKLLRELTNAPVQHTDLLYPDLAANTILFSHCGSGAFSLAANQADICLAPVRLAEEGVCACFPAKPGPVTLVNLVGHGGTLRLTVISGEAVACGMEFPGNPLKVRFERSVQDIVEQIAWEGIGHHWMAGYGHVAPEINAFCDLAGLRRINL